MKRVKNNMIKTQIHILLIILFLTAILGMGYAGLSNINLQINATPIIMI